MAVSKGLNWSVAGILLILSVLGIGERALCTTQAENRTEGGLLAQGRYLAMIAGCNDCHTDGYLLEEGKVPEELWLTGSSFGWRGPWGTTYAANLRLLVSAMTEDQWVSFGRQLRTRPPMPWYSLNVMHEPDLRGLYRFIHRLGPGGIPAPAYLRAGEEPTTPYALFPPPPPSLK